MSSPETLLRDRFGFPSFRPGQREVIEAVLERGAALAVFPTGAGKSLCYQLPALLVPDGVTLVVSPLIALMKDQVDFLRQRGIAAARLDTSLGAAEQREVVRSIRSGDLRLLYVAPERFNNERFLALLEQVGVGLFAVDEAHCISEWGHNFRPDYLKLAEAARSLGARRVLALTATATPRVVDDICAGFGIPRAQAVVTGFYRPNLDLHATPVSAGERDGLLLERLRSRPPGPAIVYTTLQRTAERVAGDLADAGLPARAYHAGMEADRRSEVQEWWAASDRAIVVATIAFGMGIDKADVRAVYHYNLPKSLEGYAQEIGRAGRDGLPAHVELFACPEDVPTLENFAYGDTPTEAALHGLLEEVLGLGDTFDVSLSDLAFRHDVRELVLRTALTYLELDGLLRQGTPVYSTYRLRLKEPAEAIAARFPGERGRFLSRVFEQGTPGRVWLTIDPAQAAEALGQERQRVVAALEYLAEQDLLELAPSGVRHTFARLAPEADPARAARLLADRFARREEHEIARVRQVLDLVTHAGCQTNYLVGAFGERRAAPCGHCTFCRTGAPRVLPPMPERAPLDSALDWERFEALCAAHPAVLRGPREQARFLCGLSSPGVQRARLAREPSFGRLAAYPFADVLAFRSAA